MPLSCAKIVQAQRPQARVSVGEPEQLPRILDIPEAFDNLMVYMSHGSRRALLCDSPLRRGACGKGEAPRGARA